MKFSKSLNGTALNLHAEAHSLCKDAAKRSKVFVGEINSHLEKVNSIVLKFKNYVKVLDRSYKSNKSPKGTHVCAEKVAFNHLDSLSIC